MSTYSELILSFNWAKLSLNYSCWEA